MTRGRFFCHTQVTPRPIPLSFQIIHIKQMPSCFLEPFYQLHGISAKSPISSTVLLQQSIFSIDSTRASSRPSSFASIMIYSYSIYSLLHISFFLHLCYFPARYLKKGCSIQSSATKLPRRDPSSVF